jgi:hypothetical protein
MQVMALLLEIIMVTFYYHLDVNSLPCRDALEAELSAVREGLSLTLHWCTQPIILEVDCLEKINLVKNEELDRSVNMSIIEEMKTLLKV